MHFHPYSRLHCYIYKRLINVYSDPNFRDAIQHGPTASQSFQDSLMGTFVETNHFQPKPDRPNPISKPCFNEN